MAYIQSNAPYQRRKKSTLQIMIELGLGLSVIWLLAIIMTFVKLGSNYGVRSIFLMVTSLATTALCDVITTVLKNKKDKELGKKIVHDLVHNYSWITAMIFTLCCPVWTRYYVIIIGSIFATMIGKNVFGGFGRNIFNPAAAGRLFVLLTFDTAAPAGIAGVDAATGATVTSAIQSQMGWLGSNAIAGFGIKDLLLGTYFGAMGEVFTLAILLVGIVLAIREVINWRIPAFYLGTITLSSLLIALILGFNNPGLYIAYHLCAGGAMFAAIFMFTDPVTTPTSPFGNCLIGVLGGLLTVLIRVGTNNPEGVVYSIMLVNTFSPAIDHFITAKTNKNTGVKSGVTFGSLAVASLLCVAVAWNGNGGREVYQINGIQIDEYNSLVSTLNIKNSLEKGYTIAKVENKVEDAALYAPTFYKLEDGTLVSEQPAESTTYEEVQYESQYLLKKGKNDVGVMYCVKVAQEILYDDEYEMDARECIAYVAIEYGTNNLLDISVYHAAQTTDENGETLGSMAVANLAKVDFTNMTAESFAALKPGTVSNGASYSFRGFQKAVKKAYEIYAKGGNK